MEKVFMFPSLQENKGVKYLYRADDLKEAVDKAYAYIVLNNDIKVLPTIERKIKNAITEKGILSFPLTSKTAQNLFNKII